MMLDALDRAFLDHWTATVAPPPPAPTECGSRPEGPVAGGPRMASEPPPASMPAAVGGGDVLDRLLRAAWDDWCAVADEIEGARRRGRRVIAVTACERGAGCSTLAAGLVRVLGSRGHDVRLGASDEAPPGGPTHDRRILVVDAGVWFPPGRIQRRRLMMASVGCDAAIVVRREDRPAPPGWSVALEAIGVEPLGEVISFAMPQADAARPGDAR